MSAITATLSGETLPRIERDFIDTPIENAVDVVTLDGSLYTDFVSQGRQWTFSYESLTKAEYDNLRAIYDAQFTAYAYPELTIPFYSLADQPVRMTINEKDIWDNCGDVAGVQIIFRETNQLNYVPPDYLLLDGTDRLIVGSGFLEL